MTTQWVKKDDGKFDGAISPEGIAGPQPAASLGFVYAGNHDPGTPGCSCVTCKMGKAGFEPTPPSEGKSRIQARLDRARSGAYGTHGDRRLKRLNTRGAKKRAALNDFD